MTNLRQLALIGNCHVAALLDERAKLVWWCVPRLDGDPFFAGLLDDDGGQRGSFAVELMDVVRAEQAYVPNTPIVVTRLYDRAERGIEITDFAPRFQRDGRPFRPATLVRTVKPLGGGGALVRVRLRPVSGYGGGEPRVTRGSNHVRYVGGGSEAPVVRLTTDMPVTYVMDEAWTRLERPAVFVLGPDDDLPGSPAAVARDHLERTTEYWLNLVGRLHLPFDWQEAVIRSAITLKLCSFEETGAIVASPTTSIPEAYHDGPAPDERLCRLRDAYPVVRALNRLGYVQTMAGFLGYLGDLVASSGEDDFALQPVYGIGREHDRPETRVDTLAGYRGGRPVRVGIPRSDHPEHDAYGSVVLAATQAFFDLRLREPARVATFRLLERLGERAWEHREEPDGGYWGFGGPDRVHTHSVLMCWAACDRLARIADRLNLHERQAHWTWRADAIRGAILERAWNGRRGCFVGSFGGEDLDACLLRMHEVGLVQATDPRFVATVDAIGRELVEGPFVRPHSAEGAAATWHPEHALVACSYWYIDALAATGRREQARRLFEQVLPYRSGLGLLAGHVDRRTGELWGNFPAAHAHVGLINCATRLSRGWDEIV